jgi:hypothetical protein
MEGTAKEVRPDVFWHPFRTALLLSIICLPSGTLARSNGDSFLVLQHPGRLLVFNKYQQQATEAQLKLLAPFAPMRILKSDALLADGFTPCMQVELGGEIFFLLKDKRGKLISSGPPGFEQTFRGATLLLDSVQILIGRSVRFSPIDASPEFLQPGEKVVRIFRYRDAVYCARAGVTPAYGWAGLTGKGGGKFWRVIAAQGSLRTSIPPLIVERIRSRVTGMNQLLVRLFEHFNTETHQQKAVPRWTMETLHGAISCTLDGAPQGEYLERSTPYLVRDIENIVLGSSLEVSHAPGKIEIRQP